MPGLGLCISFGGLLSCGLLGSGITVSRNFDQKSKYVRADTCPSSTKIFSAVQVCWILAAVTDERSTKIIALTTAVVNMKFFANLIIGIHSLLKFICVGLRTIAGFLKTRKNGKPRARLSIFALLSCSRQKASYRLSSRQFYKVWLFLSLGKH